MIDLDGIIARAEAGVIFGAGEIEFIIKELTMEPDWEGNVEDLARWLGMTTEMPVLCYAEHQGDLARVQQLGHLLPGRPVRQVLCPEEVQGYSRAVLMAVNCTMPEWMEAKANDRHFTGYKFSIKVLD